MQVYKAQGATKQKAIENAQMIEYTVDVNDSVMTFDSNIQFKKDAIFRAQRLDMTLYIPYNHPFVMDEPTARFISQYIDWEDMDGYTWEMNEKGLKCLNCPISEEEKNNVADDFGLTDFDEIEIRGIFDVSINRGDTYAVELLGSETDKEKYKIYRLGSTLVIDYERLSKDFDWDVTGIDEDEIRINITMPSLDKIEAEGYGKIEFDNFQTDNIDIDLRGPVKLSGEIDTRDLVINLKGNSEADLSGRATNLDAELQFASKLRAYNLEVEEAIVEASGASSAKVNVSKSLEMEEGLASDIDYRGNPHVIKRD